MSNSPRLAQGDGGQILPRQSPVSQDPNNHNRKSSQSSASSSSSQITALSTSKPLPYARPNAPAQTIPNASTVDSRTAKAVSFKSAHDLPLRRYSPSTNGMAPSSLHRHKHVRHIQGFFEPSLPTASQSNSSTLGSHLTASQIAAQAAMHVQSSAQFRQRSQSIPEPIGTGKVIGKRKPSNNTPTLTLQTAQSSHSNISQNRSEYRGPSPLSTTAAAVAFPRSPLHSPSLSLSSDHISSLAEGQANLPAKEKSRMKLFSKPKHITISKDKESDKKAPLPSPRKGVYSSASSVRFASQSTTSLADSAFSGASSMYSTANASTSTLTPLDRALVGEKEKDKHRHNFLSRQKAKLKDNLEHHNLALSSASSNSRPADPSAPQSLYSFAPSSPGPSSAFNKSISGLDLRHGGRALREKKREGKPTVSALLPLVANSSSRSDSTRNQTMQNTSEWPAATNIGIAGTFGPPSATTTHSLASDFLTLPQASMGFGLPGMTSDDAWPFLKARLLNIFEGEDLRMPVEDFNRLLSVHLQRCIQRRAPSLIIEDLRDLLQTGFASLDHQLRHIPDDRLVLHLVEMWSFVFSTVLPFLQAVFLPLDLELRGRGSIMSPREAAEFWGALPSLSKTGLSKNTKQSTSEATVLDVRTLVLLTFRDSVILPRHDNLLVIFSRLSLESINAAPADDAYRSTLRPGTATSASVDPATASFNSQGSTLLDSSAAGSLGARSRATSNVSAGSFHSINSPRHINANHRAQPRDTYTKIDSAKVMETAAGMLQCVSVLAGLQGPGGLRNPGAGEQAAEDEDDEILARRKMERLAKELKLNWLGRGRTGRNRMGFVGSRVRNPIGIGVDVGA